LREDITASRSFAMPKSCYRGLAEGSGKALADGRRFQDYRAYRIRWVVFIKHPDTQRSNGRNQVRGFGRETPNFVRKEKRAPLPQEAPPPTAVP
jgi:hypothetical protein